MWAIGRGPGGQWVCRPGRLRRAGPRARGSGRPRGLGAVRAGLPRRGPRVPGGAPDQPGPLVLLPQLCCPCRRRYFFNKEGDFNNLTAAAFHKKTHLLVTGFASGIFHLHELPEFNLIHSLRWAPLPWRVVCRARRSDGWWQSGQRPCCAPSTAGPGVRGGHRTASQDAGPRLRPGQEAGEWRGLR